MARRDSLDHAGFITRRGTASRRRECGDGMRHRGLRKANVDAVAASPREHDARWMPGRRVRGISQWPPVLGDEIGGNSRAGTRYTGVTLARGARRGGGHDGVVGRDFSVDGSNAP